MKTALDWLFLNVDICGVSSGSGLTIDEIKDKAKKLEENQIKAAWLSAWKDSMLNPLADECYQELADEYYNQNYDYENI
jgi:hypothetical protein